MYFPQIFADVTGYAPMQWQSRLFHQFVDRKIPNVIDLPTGLGKTSVMAIWLIARALASEDARKAIPRRLVYVVDRRAVVDQATEVAEGLRKALSGAAADLRQRLGLADGDTFPISTLRGQYADNRDWLADPASPAIIVGTVDMIGSRLLFEGYGVSRKTRSYHAGLLGADTLVVLDEAHLVPPFEALLQSIECGSKDFGPRGEDDRKIIPPFRLLSLSATGRAREGVRFQLEEGDLVDPVVRGRMSAKKRIELRKLDSGGLDAQLAQAAWTLSEQGTAAKRILIFCDRRDKKEDAAGPSAAGVYEEIERLAAGDKKKGVAPVVIEEPQLFVGGRRVKERQDAAERLKSLGFLAGSALPAKSAFLIATSAGEVGVDLDADHMVCDLVPWERMAQRLGRVNRRGEGDATVVIVHGEAPKPKKSDAPTEQEKRQIVGFHSLAVVAELRDTVGGKDASPGALRELKLRAETDEALRRKIDEATTPVPLRPALTRPLVDAWSMTSLETHTGRPEIAPWLRGWVEDDQPQTSIVWRKYLPVRRGRENWPNARREQNEVEAFFEAAPPHRSELLETETFRVTEWLIARAKTALKRAESEAVQGDRSESESQSGDVPLEEQTGNTGLPPLKPTDVVAFALDNAGDLRKSYKLGDLAEDDGKKAKDRLGSELRDAILVVDARLHGIDNGLLASDADRQTDTADATEGWSREAEFRVRCAPILPPSPGDWRFENSFALEKDEDGEVTKSLVIERFKSSNSAEEGRSISRPQSLAQHQSWAERKACALAAAAGLIGDHAEALAIAARLHDEGKRAPRWQLAFNANGAPGDIEHPLAKTSGPFKNSVLDGYRHEFGSLPHAEADAAFKALRKRNPELADLVLHLIASHHGGARPVISAKSCEDAPPSALAARARDAALRFAQLQKRWGPWGLAWWEALLRAADQQASRDNDKGMGFAAPNTEEK